MSDRVFFTLAGLFAVLAIALAMVAPQGLGARSVGPFRRPLGPVDPEVTALAAAKAREKLLHPPRPPRLAQPVRQVFPGAPPPNATAPAVVAPTAPAPAAAPAPRP